LYPSILLEFNIATNTQIGRIDIYNRWKVRLKRGNGDQIFYIKDPGNAHDFEYGDIKEGNKIIKIRKKVSLYLDPEFTKPVAENIDYISEDYETLEYVKVYEHENAFNFDKHSRGGEFIENLVTDNEIEFCHRWLHLANFKELLEDIDEYYRANSIGAYSEFDKPNCPIRPSTIGTLYSPITFREGNKTIKPIRFMNIPEKKI